MGVFNPLNVNSVLIDESNTTASCWSRPMDCVEAFWALSTNYLITGPDGQPRLGDYKHVEVKAVYVFHDGCALTVDGTGVGKPYTGHGGLYTFTF